MKKIFSMQVLTEIIKNALLFVALWVAVLFFVAIGFTAVDAMSGAGGDWKEGVVAIVVALCMSVLVVFVWKRVAKKYL